jgi:hypothetical protein
MTNYKLAAFLRNLSNDVLAGRINSISEVLEAIQRVYSTTNPTGAQTVANTARENNSEKPLDND